MPPVNQACAVLCIAAADAAAARVVRGGRRAESGRRWQENDATPLLNWFFLQMKILDARPGLLYCIYGGGKEASK